MKTKSLIFILFLFSFPVFGQSMAYLALSQSPLLFGAGEIGTAIPTNEALGYYNNPANLGYWSRENNASFYFMPGKSNWLGLEDLKFNSYGINLGYSIGKDKKHSPLSIGFGYLHSSMDYFSSPGDFFNGYSLGVSLYTGLIFNFGVSIKSFESKIAPYKASGTAYDAGALVILPVSDLYLNNIKFDVTNHSYIKPVVALSAGYAIANIGDKIKYINDAQADPIYRTARLGYSLNIGFDVNINENVMNAINYSFTAEAEDVLVKHRDNDSSEFEYQNILGDINFKRNLIELKGDNNVVVHRGHIFQIAEILTLTSGNMNGSGFIGRKFNGWGLSSNGIFKILNMAVDNSILRFISSHCVIEYFNASIFTDLKEFKTTKLKGMTISLRNFVL